MKQTQNPLGTNQKNGKEKKKGKRETETETETQRGNKKGRGSFGSAMVRKS